MNRRSIQMALVVSSLFQFSWTVRADTFAPIRCPSPVTIPSWQINTGFSIWEPVYDVDKAFECVSNEQGNLCPHYANWIDSKWWVLANQYVNRFDFYISSFRTEQGYDFLKYGTLGGQVTNLSGSVSAGWKETTVASSLQASPIELRFVSDLSVTAAGFVLDGARVSCHQTGSANGVTEIPVGRRVMGLLLGDNDTVYFKFAAQSSLEHSIALWGPDGTDFNLYLRCNALPTPSTYNYRARSFGNSDEYLRTWTGGCAGGTWYGAVNSRSGSGAFNLLIGVNKPEQRINLTVGVNHNASEAYLAVYAEKISVGLKQFYGATEGAIIVESALLFNDSGANCQNCDGSPCDVCIHDQVDRAYATGICGGRIFLPAQQCILESLQLTHEMGHTHMCLGDEYIDVHRPCTPPDSCLYGSCQPANDVPYRCKLTCTVHDNCPARTGCIDGYCQGSMAQCTHTIMGTLSHTRNFCYDEPYLGGNHPKDKAVSTLPDSTLADGWDQAASAGVIPTSAKPLNSPDRHEFRTHDFNGLVGSVFIVY